MSAIEPMDLAIREEPTAALGRAVGGVNTARLLNAFLAGRNVNTRDGYAKDLENFRAFLDAPDAKAAVEQLLGRGHGDANALALDYRAFLIARGLAAASVNRALSSLRSLVKMARVIGLVPWALEVENLKARPYRDTRGPGREGFVAMLAKLTETPNARTVRDAAILRLLYERGLRRNEVRLLDFADVDFQLSRVNVLGKGRTNKEWMTIAPTTIAAIEEWVTVRGRHAGPLFCGIRFSSTSRVVTSSSRLSGQGIFRIVRWLGESIEIRARPHGLRHAAITEALDRGESPRSVQRFSRHADLATLMIYDDNRQDLGGDVACMLSEPTPKPGTFAKPAAPPAQQRAVAAAVRAVRAQHHAAAAMKARAPSDRPSASAPPAQAFPAQATLDSQTIRRIAAEARCDARTVKSIARGTIPKQESGLRALEALHAAGLVPAAGGAK